MKHVSLFLSLALLPLALVPAYADDPQTPQLVRLQELDPPSNGSHACVSGDRLSIVWEVGGKVWKAERKNADSLFEIGSPVELEVLRFSRKQKIAVTPK